MATLKTFIKRHAVLTYFVVTFAISTGGILIAVAREGVPLNIVASPMLALALFAGPSVAGILLTGLIHGRAGLRAFLSRLLRWRVGVQWYAAALLITPLLATPILLVLGQRFPDLLPAIVTADDKTALLLLGLQVGLIGGFLEELGWTGFAVPELRRRHTLLSTALIVSAVWAAWHVPVTFFSTVSPSGVVDWSLFLPPLFFYFGVLPAYRVLMVWVYDHTESLLVAMLMHASLTAGMLILQPLAMSGMILLTWLLAWAAVQWIVVAVVNIASRGHVGRQTLGGQPA